ncbi:MAG: toprim domain-containing protein [Gammaproteobacteria bacterium]|nr:toprim domain-containing protein [Gammaproteobacteria bacterium]
MATIVIAEKPSMARDIAKVLGANQRANGHLHSNDYIVTWAIGHLVTLAQPHEINPAWKSWSSELLPMLPQQWTLSLNPKTEDQFQIVAALMTQNEARHTDLRHRCRARRRADFPLHPPAKRLHQALSTPLDLLSHPRRHSHRL